MVETMWACVTGLGRMVNFPNVGWLVSVSKVLDQSDPVCKGIPKLPRPELELGEVATSNADLKKLTGATTAFFPSAVVSNHS